MEPLGGHAGAVSGAGRRRLRGHPGRGSRTAQADDDRSCRGDRSRRRHPDLPADLRPSASCACACTLRLARAGRAQSGPHRRGTRIPPRLSFRRRSAAADRRVLHTHLRGTQIRAWPRHYHRQRQIRPACGLARRRRGRRRRAGAVSQRKDHARRARLRSCQCEHGAACAGRGARRLLGRGDEGRFHVLRSGHDRGCRTRDARAR